MCPQLRRELRNIGGNEVVGHHVLQEIEPEQRELGEHASFVRDPGSEHVIEGGDAVGSDEQKMIAIDLVNVADLAARVELQFWDVGVQQYGGLAFRSFHVRI